MPLVLSRPAVDAPLSGAPSAPAAPRPAARAPILDPGNLVDHAHLALRQAMMRGELMPDQRLKPRDIAAALSISETPVREALQRLAQEGLVVLEPRRAMRVRRLTLEEYLELRDIREQLESLAAIRALPALRDGALPVLRRLHEQVADSRACADWEAVRQANFEFHFTIYRASAMPALVGLLETMWARSGPTFAELYAHAQSRYAGRHPHLEALDAIEADDAPALAAAILRDMREGGARLVARMRAEREAG